MSLALYSFVPTIVMTKCEIDTMVVRPRDLSIVYGQNRENCLTLSVNKTNSPF